MLLGKRVERPMHLSRPFAPFESLLGRFAGVERLAAGNHLALAAGGRLTRAQNFSSGPRYRHLPGGNPPSGMLPRPLSAKALTALKRSGVPIMLF